MEILITSMKTKIVAQNHATFSNCLIICKIKSSSSTPSMTHKIAIIGSGAFACAVYSAVRDVPGNEISMYFKDEDCYADIITKGGHPTMPCVFDTFTKLTLDLDVAVNGAQTIFLCCVFAAAREVIDNLAAILGTATEFNLIICCKGMLAEEPFFLCDYAESKLPRAHVMVLSGGSFADEMCRKQQTHVNLACKDVAQVQELTPLFDGFLHITPTDKIHETEFLGAMKNIMAIYCGYLSRHGSVNEVIGGLTEFLQGTKAFFEAIGFDTTALFSQAGIGDIMLTCLSGKSRNRTFGELLGKDPRQAKKFQQSTTIEGYDAMFAIKKFCQAKKVSFHALEEVVKVVEE